MRNTRKIATVPDHLTKYSQQESTMDPKLQAQIKDYLTNNLSLTFDIQSDIYNLYPDQTTINLCLEGEVINTIVLNDFNDN